MELPISPLLLIEGCSTLVMASWVISQCPSWAGTEIAVATNNPHTRRQERLFFITSAFMGR